MFLNGFPHMDPLKIGLLVKGEWENLTNAKI